MVSDAMVVGFLVCLFSYFVLRRANIFISNLTFVAVGLAFLSLSTVEKSYAFMFFFGALANLVWQLFHKEGYKESYAKL